MKIQTLLLTFCFAMILTSCKDENHYSCDPEIEIWTKANLSEIKQMSTAEFIKLDPSKQIAVYRAFDPNQKIQLWQEKITELLQMDFTEKERLHIQQLSDVLETKSYWFSDFRGQSNTRSQEIQNEIDIYVYRWTTYAKEELYWDDEFLYKIAGNPNPPSVIDEIAANNMMPETLAAIEECRCQTSWEACKPFDCVKGNCEVVGKGCGWLLLQECNGRCGVEPVK